MAIYHFSGQVISRSSGRSAVACACYRSGQKLYDGKQDKVLDFTNKHDIAHSEILLPEGAPEWMADREQLWNAVERSELRKDAQLAREFNISLPRELSMEQNLELMREFIKNEFVSQGMVADLNLHLGTSKEGEEQPHAHVMLTMREIVEDGFGMKERSWNAKENLLKWRESWAEHANKYLALNDIDLRIDHRSLEEQGIDLEAQKKIGANILRVHEERVLAHQNIARENGEKIYADPNIALNALTHQQSTFTRYDIARFINRHTADAEQYQRVYDKVRESEQLLKLGDDRRGMTRFSTAEMVALEKDLITKADQLDQQLEHQVPAQNIDELMANTKLTPEQQDGLNHLIAAGDLKCLIGYAGTGKSTLLKEAKNLWESAGYNVLCATLSGIAAENLEGASGITSRTFASRDYYWNKDQQHLTDKDILVVDEAGMLGSRQMAKIISEVTEHNAKLVLIGDPQQLQAIEAGAAFRAITERCGAAFLTNIVRQREAWQREATKDFANQQTEQALARYEEHGNIHVYTTQDDAKKALVQKWNDTRLAEPEKSQIMLAYTRDEVAELNNMAREFRKKNHELGASSLILTTMGYRGLAAGEKIYFLKNNRDLGVMNGTLGVIEKITGDIITTKLDKEQDGAGRAITFNVKDYNHITYGYAATIHKAQSVTVDHSYILASNNMDSHLAYVGMSRHREHADLFYSREQFSTQQDLAATLNRDRSKDTTIDYMGREIDRHYENNLNKLNKIHDQTQDSDRGDQKVKEHELIIKYREADTNYQKAQENSKDWFTKCIAEGELKHYTNELCKSKEAMDCLQKTDKELHRQMYRQFQEMQKRLQLQKDREIEF